MTEEMTTVELVPGLTGLRIARISISLLAVSLIVAAVGIAVNFVEGANPSATLRAVLYTSIVVWGSLATMGMVLSFAARRRWKEERLAGYTTARADNQDLDQVDERTGGIIRPGGQHFLGRDEFRETVSRARRQLPRVR